MLTHPITPVETPEKIPREWRRTYLITAWIIAAVITVITHPLLIPIAVLFAWGFPFGIFRLMFSPDDKSLRQYEAIIVIGGWLFYGGLTLYAWAQNRVGRFVIIYGILFLLLILNAIGCNKMLDDPIMDSL